MFQFPDGSLKYITQQRSESLNCDSPEIAYEESIQKDYDTMRDLLPPSIMKGAILDIGCGLGAIDVLLASHYQYDNFYLMDGTGWAQKRVGFNFRMDAFNDLLLTEKMISLNVTEDVAKNFSFVDYKSYQKENIEPCKLILSLYSWGFHFPVATYLDFAAKQLIPGGRLILDVRIKTPGINELDSDERLKKIKVISNIPFKGDGAFQKGVRVCYERI